ncbi:DMT family transporter [Kushneria aurantia]|uniref:DMT family transporter n=1 Tax=Kushneria aurantia TaxID=504092 RepID=A0ABV6G1B5_9GAMM|nr:DMT family transporter [Kushneria aurantia]
MRSVRQQQYLASALVVLAGSVWGLYWLPIRAISTQFLPGGWGSLAATLMALVVLSPAALYYRGDLRRLPLRSLLWLLLGGASFMFYSIGLVHGRVATVILLFYLTPVWSTLIARLALRWPVPPLRYAVIVVGLCGLALVLSAEGGLPLPQGVGDWLGLASGVIWALATTGMRLSPMPGAAVSAFVFALGGALAALVLATLMTPWPGLPALAAWPLAAGQLLLAGGLWWGLAMVALLWATARLDPTRVGILLMSEVLVGVLSAAWLANEPFGALAVLGAVLVITAAALELWPVRRSVDG